MLQQQRPAVTPASYAHRPESFPKIIAPNIAPNTAKKITTNAPGLKYSARVENFRILLQNRKDSKEKWHHERGIDIFSA